MKTMFKFIAGVVIVVAVIFIGYMGYRYSLSVIHSDDFMTYAVEELRGIRKALEKK